MIPQILQQLNQMPLNLSGVKQMMSMMRGNPQAMLQTMMQNNPNMRQVTDIIQQHGGDPQKAFYALCEQKGINPNQILDALK